VHKRSEIKWRDKDVAELQRVVKNFNAKIARVAKKSPHKVEFLPSKITVAELRGKIETRADFNRELNSAKRFSTKGSEEIKTDKYGRTKTKYEFKEISRKLSIVNAKRNKELKLLDAKTSEGNMGTIDANNLKPKSYPSDTREKAWEKFVESLEKEIRSNFKSDQEEEYKRRYLQAVKDNLKDGGYDLYNHVSELDASFIMKHSLKNPILSIQFVYEPSDMSEEDKADHIMNEWMEME